MPLIGISFWSGANEICFLISLLLARIRAKWFRVSTGDFRGSLREEWIFVFPFANRDWVMGNDAKRRESVFVSHTGGWILSDWMNLGENGPDLLTSKSGCEDEIVINPIFFSFPGMNLMKQHNYFNH